jgi:hypothetical protein
MKLLKAFSILALALAMSSCATVKVAVDENKNIDFSQYKTYSFLGWQNQSDQVLSAEDKGYLRDAFINQFERRGMTMVNSGGDMQVSLYIIISEESAVSGYNDYVAGAGFTNYYGFGYGTGNMNNTYTTASKEFGTLIMNCYDGKSRDQIWQAIATSAVQQKVEKRKGTIPSKIANIMSYFPVKPVKGN